MDVQLISKGRLSETTTTYELTTPYHQRGAVAVFAAIAMVGLIAALGFTLNIAQMYNAKRALQGQANMAALNAARAAGGCLAPDDPRGRAVVARQAVNDTLVSLGGDASWLQNGSLQLGGVLVDGEGLRHFQALPDNQASQAYAFQVQLQRPFPKLLVPLPGMSSDAVLTAKATSTQAPAVSYRVGAYIANVSSGDVALLNSLLEALLGEDPQLEIIGVSGLASTAVDLQQVATELGQSTIEQMLNDPITFPNFLSALINVLVDGGQNITADAVAAIAAIAPSNNIFLADVLPDGSDLIRGAGNAAVNVLDLIQATAMQLGDPVLSLLPEINIPGVADLSAEVIIGKPMTLGLGPALKDELGSYLTSAINSQAEINLELSLLSLLGDLVSVNLEIDLAEAQADLLELQCAGRDRPQPRVVIGAQTSVASIRLNNDGFTGPPLVNVLGLIQVCASSAPVGTPDIYDVMEFEGPFDPGDPDILAANTQTAGNGLGVELSDLISDVLDGTEIQFCPGSPTGLLLNLLLGPVLALLGVGSANGVLDIVENLLDVALAGVVDPLLEPLLRSLGVDLIGTRVTVLDVYHPSPALIDAE